MINSILAHMRSDDDLTKIVVLIPITEKLSAAIKRCQSIIEENKTIIKSVNMDSSIINELSFPSEQFANTFRSDLPEEGDAVIVKYALKAIKAIFLSLEISKDNIAIFVVDEDDFSYGYVFPVTIPISEVLK